MQFKVPGDDEVYTLVAKMTWAEAEAFERVVGMTMARLASLDELDRPTVAMRASFWVSMKRKNPTLAFADLEDIVFEDSEFMPEDDEEKASMEEHGVDVVPTNPAPEATDAETATGSLSVA